MTTWTEEETQKFLSEIELFHEIPGNLKKDLCEKAKIRKCSSGELILQRGEAGNSLFVIASGKIRVTIEGKSGQQDVSTLERGSFFGEIAMMTHAHRTATITAVSETVLLEFTARDILPLTEKYPEFKSRLGRTGAKRSRDSMSKLIGD